MARRRHLRQKAAPRLLALLAVLLLALVGLAPAAAFFRRDASPSDLPGGWDWSFSDPSPPPPFPPPPSPAPVQIKTPDFDENPFQVLTAAHCVDAFHPGEMPIIHIGRYCQGVCTGLLARYNRYETAAAERVYVQRDWIDMFRGNDIAVYTLTEPVRTRPVRVDVRGAADLHSGTNLNVAGLGVDESGGLSGFLQEGIIPYRPNPICAAAFDAAQDAQQLRLPSQFSVRDSMICAGGETAACRGDSGGPLLLMGSAPEEDLLVGVVSFGVQCSINIDTRLPSIFTRVSSFECPARPVNQAITPPNDPSFVYAPGFVCVGDVLQYFQDADEPTCRNACRINPACGAYTFSAPYCILRATCTSTTPFATAISGAKAFQSTPAPTPRPTNPPVVLPVVQQPPAMSFNYQQGIACGGPSLQQIDGVSNLQLCQVQCAQQIRCLWFTFNGRTSRCFLKDNCNQWSRSTFDISAQKVGGSMAVGGIGAVTAPIITPVNQVVAPIQSRQGGDRYDFVSGVNCRSATLRYINTDSMPTCQAECSRDGNCAAVSMHLRRQRCYLKAACMRDSDSGHNSAIRMRGMSIPTVASKWGCLDREYQEIPRMSRGACSDACRRDNRCKLFTHNTSTAACKLHGDCSRTEENNNLDTGFFVTDFV
eukprot:jgi/Tetstr1/439304/TSEL_027745.t1